MLYGRPKAQARLLAEKKSGGRLIAGRAAAEQDSAALPD
jgi:hypothetical protein